jgi:uncharacterized 2Fe-2S/4Fe-4S cluster protein (DUF4445 family)
MTLKVKIHPGGKEIETGEGIFLIDLLLENGVFVESLCSGRGFCGRCIVKILRGSGPPEEVERRILGEDGTVGGFRLACITKVASDMEIQLLTEEIPLSVDGSTGAVPERSSFTLQSIEEGSYVFKAGESRVFLGVVPDPVLGVAVDAGTTTIEALLVDLKDGSVKGEVREMNRQISVGTDIISRISYGIKSDGNRENLRKVLIGSIDKAITDLMISVGAKRENIVACSLSGNVFIIHSLLGKSLKGLAKFPFSPPLTDTLLLPDILPLSVGENGCILLYPSPGAFIGGDLVAGAISLSLDVEGVPSLFIDIGTNTEILLRKGAAWVAASTPSGGAFEGAEMKCGKLAIPGAITSCAFDRELLLNVIGGGEPDGISGSGIVSLVSLLLSMGLLTRDGRLLSTAEARGVAPPSILWRLTDMEGENAFILYLAERGGRPVYLSQSDVRNFQTAKGAIRAALETALRELGLLPPDVERVYVSGAFGKGVEESELITVGIFPPEFEGKVIKAGNSSLKGAYLYLVDREGTKRAKNFAEKVKVIHLGGNRIFSEKFIEHMNF